VSCVLSYGFCSKFHTLSSSVKFWKSVKIWQSYREFKRGKLELFWDTLYLTLCTVRLVGGSSSREGRLEILHNGVWTSACYVYVYTWYMDTVQRRTVNDAAARVVCSTLGFGYVEASGSYSGCRFFAAQHRSRIRYLSKKFANLNEFSEIKKS